MKKSTKKLNVIYPIILSIILINFECFAQNLEPKSSVSKNINIQSLTTLSSTKGHAFGESTHRQIINHLSEIPISNLASLGALTQLSRVDSTYQNNTEAYSFNGVEFFHRYRFASTKFINFIVHNSYRFHGIYNENKYLSLMPKQNDYELRLLLAHNMTDRLINNLIKSNNRYFARLELAYRHKFNNPFDEIRERFYLGFNINPKFSLLFQHDLIWAVTAKESPTKNSFKHLQNFDFSKNFNHIISPSLIYKNSNDSAWQFGYFKRISGNDGQYDSQGFNIGYLKSF